MNRFELIHEVPGKEATETTEATKPYPLYLTVTQDALDPPVLELSYMKFQFESWEEYEFFVRMCSAHVSPFVPDGITAGGMH